MPFTLNMNVCVGLQLEWFLDLTGSLPPVAKRTFSSGRLHPGSPVSRMLYPGRVGQAHSYPHPIGFCSSATFFLHSRCQRQTSKQSTPLVLATTFVPIFVFFSARLSIIWKKLFSGLTARDNLLADAHPRTSLALYMSRAPRQCHPRVSRPPPTLIPTRLASSADAQMLRGELLMRSARTQRLRSG